MRAGPHNREASEGGLGIDENGWRRLMETG
jgi:hypothetical protein